MDYRRLGRTGLKVSELCLGTMQFGWTADGVLSKQILTAAYEAGINFIDTANVYSRWVEGNPGGIAETIIGDWIKESAISRHNLIIATKVRGPMGSAPNDEGLSRVHIMKAVEDSLIRLGTDYIDLYQTHWPDDKTPIEETLSALDDLTRQGKIRYSGCSNYPAWRLTDAIWTAKHHQLTGYISLQPHYNLVHREEFERELADVCHHFVLGVIPYSPLAKGFLTGKYTKGSLPDSARLRSVKRYFTDHNWKLLDELHSIGKHKGGYSISQIALAWLLSNPLVTSPIIGPRSIDQLQDNLGAVELKLDLEERSLLDEASSWK
jgi:aryl-alcohol dehydrogenase-like predicted oxidoreductase